ncbi:MAG: hypothetical protein Q8M65_08850 [Rhodoglobus sp.]|nr:hypothetical protein [Rhodoglobus sp.]
MRVDAKEFAVPRLTLASPKVVAEVIDGEAIVLDLRAGVYFVTEGVGAVAWAAAIEGWTTDEISASASDTYPSHPTAHEDIAALLEGFVGADLLVASDANDRQPSLAIAWPTAYVKPALESHNDLQDMMQLDPIHDTDASGWPMPAPGVSP